MTHQSPSGRATRGNRAARSVRHRRWFRGSNAEWSPPPRATWWVRRSGGPLHARRVSARLRDQGVHLFREHRSGPLERPGAAGDRPGRVDRSWSEHPYRPIGRPARYGLSLHDRRRGGRSAVPGWSCRPPSHDPAHPGGCGCRRGCRSDEVRGTLHRHAVRLPSVPRLGADHCRAHRSARQRRRPGPNGRAAGHRPRGQGVGLGRTGQREGSGDLDRRCASGVRNRRDCRRVGAGLRSVPGRRSRELPLHVEHACLSSHLETAGSRARPDSRRRAVCRGCLVSLGWCWCRCGVVV
jgi:hypothetical protein